ncbi:response regulator transcription factor [Actinokineospora sp. G85]|uniref:helix-turn-helix transcriptional regulator n=1 Tax=Actinokineospora sp. G85 TaxID=3406626 RepID=UPI003C76AA44
MIDRTNVVPMADRRITDGVDAAIVALDELLAILEKLGDFARRARGGLPAGREQADECGAVFVPEQQGVPRPAEPEQPADRVQRLTRRQLEVLNLLTQGLSNRRIGRSLHITEQTVKAHLHMIYHKLGAADRTEAVVIAMHRGLVPRGHRAGPVQD